jgi:hypothetical protein
MGAAHGSLVEVRGELKPGLMVVVRGNERLRPGQPVQILPSRRPSGSHSGKGITICPMTQKVLEKPKVLQKGKEARREGE